MSNKNYYKQLELLLKRKNISISEETEILRLLLEKKPKDSPEFSATLSKKQEKIFQRSKKKLTLKISNLQTEIEKLKKSPKTLVCTAKDVKEIFNSLQPSFEVPLSISSGTKVIKNIFLNQNNYRNQHHRILSTLKKSFSQIVIPRIKNSFKYTKKYQNKKVWIHYKIFYPDNTRRDLGNNFAVLDKFTEDCLVDAKIIIDDSFDHVTHISSSFGGIDKENPRCEVSLIII